MKIYKYLHSCILFEKNDYRLLTDPGKFSFTEGLIDPGIFRDVSALIITHTHADHLDTDVLKKITGLSGAAIYANDQVGEKLIQAGLKFILITDMHCSIGPFEVDFISVEHEAILDSPLPQMTAFVIDGKILNPADSFAENLQQFKGIELLLLPVMAPFTTEVAVAKFADALLPKKIIPIHDGYAKEFFLKQRYENYTRHFDKKGIKFFPLMQPGEYIEL